MPRPARPGMPDLLVETPGVTPRMHPFSFLLPLYWEARSVSGALETISAMVAGIIAARVGAEGIPRNGAPASSPFLFLGQGASDRLPNLPTRWPPTPPDVLLFPEQHRLFSNPSLKRFVFREMPRLDLAVFEKPIQKA